MAYYLSRENVDTFRKRMGLLSIVDPGAWTRVGVHFGLFFGALRGQATPGQLSYWVEKGALSLNGLTGCFAMTELGHGSNVAGLETTCTFDEANDEFVLHTPSITATKWWIGGAAQTATHSVVFARLIVKGKQYGVKCFVVQLRDPKTFKLMPGIVIGDIGAKMGRHGTDNGWIQVFLITSLIPDPNTHSRP
jgi:acyl-CoA oxidase